MEAEEVHRCNATRVGAPSAVHNQEAAERHAHGDSEGDEKVLVMVVPDGARVHITSGENPADSGDEGKWKQIDLKTDIMLWAHEQKSHPRIADTIASVR